MLPCWDGRCDARRYSHFDARVGWAVPLLPSGPVAARVGWAVPLHPFRPARGGGHEARGPVATGKGRKVGTESPLRGEQSRLHFCPGDVFVPPRKRRDGAAGGGGYKRRGRASWGKHLCAWGNDAAYEVIPRRVNCWLKTISKPPHWPSKAFENFWKGSLSSEKGKPYKSIIKFINKFILHYFFTICKFVYSLNK